MRQIHFKTELKGAKRLWWKWKSTVRHLGGKQRNFNYNGR